MPEDDKKTPVEPVRARASSQKFTAWGFVQGYLARLTADGAVRPMIGLGLDADGDLAIWLPDGTAPEKLPVNDEITSQTIWSMIKRRMGGE
jgi:hypothetical protein